MSSSPPSTCSRCAAPLAPEVPGTLCPSCFGTNLFAGWAPGPAAEDSVNRSAAGRAGDYELDEELGRGGMGVVYRARQISLNRPAAVKLILTGPLASALERQRFLAEAEAAAALEHPAIVSIYEAGEEDGQPYFAMQLIEGESLAARLRRIQAPLPPREAAQLMLRMTQGVQHAHERGFLHRDLKPGNVLLSSDGAPHITDFGLARRMDSEAQLTLTGAAVGTPAYMAPEQTDTRRPPTTAVDIYSLGAIFYELLSGHPPFRADSLPELFIAIREKEPASISSIRAEVDRDLDIICRKCLEKEPARRYRSAQALADDLEHWLDGEPIAARPVSRPERLWRWCRRRPALAALAATCVVLILTVAIGSSIAVVKISASRAAERAALAESRMQLRTALVSEARAGRASGAAGVRSRGLDALRRAAAVGSEPETRDEMIAHLTLFDVESVQGGPLIHWEKGKGGAADATPAFDISAATGPARTLRFYSGLFSAETAHWKPGSRNVERLFFRPDGKVAAIQVTGPEVVLLETTTQKALATLSGVWFSTWSPDGAVLIVFERGDRYHFHDGRTFVRLGSVQGKNGGDVACNPRPGTTQAAIPGENEIIIHDWTANKKITALDGAGKVCAVAWQGDVLSAGTADGRVLWWNLARGTTGGSSQQGVVAGIHAIPEKNQILTYSWDASSQLIDTQAGRLLASSRNVYPRRIHQNGRDLLFVNREVAGLARIAAPQSCHVIDLAEAGEGAIVPDFSPDGRWLVIVCDNTAALQLCELPTGRRFILPLPFKANNALFLADSRHLLVSGTDTARVLDLQAEENGPLPALPVRVVDYPEGRFLQANLSGTRDRAVTASTRGGALLFDPHKPGSNPIAVPFRAAPAAPRGGCSFSPDGAWLALGSFHGEGLRVWDLRGNAEGPLLNSSSGNAAFSPDGHRLLHTSQPVMKLYESGTWKPSGEIRSGTHTELPGTACWHPDSRHLAVLRETQVVDLWDTLSFTVKATLTPHTSMPLGNLAFSPDGRFLAVATGVRRVLLWDLAHLAGELDGAGVAFDFPVPPVKSGIPSPEFTPRLCFPPRPAGLNASHLNLDAHFNQMLQFQSSDDLTGNVVPLSPGHHALDGTDFDVRGLVRLADTVSWRRFPSRIPEILVGRTCHHLHFLQSTVGGKSIPGQSIAVVRTHYADGQSGSFPLRLGEETADWWDSTRVPHHATVAWTGTSDKKDSLVLWKYTWTNPRPEVTVTSISLESAMNEGSLMLAGITAE